MTFLIPFVFITFSSCLMTIFTHRRFEEVLPLTLMLSTLIIFIFGICNHMIWGYYLIFIFAALFPIILIIYFIKRKRLKNQLLEMFTPGFVVFVSVK